MTSVTLKALFCRIVLVGFMGGGIISSAHSEPFFPLEEAAPTKPFTLFGHAVTWPEMPFSLPSRPSFLKKLPSFSYICAFFSSITLVGLAAYWFNFREKTSSPDQSNPLGEDNEVPALIDPIGLQIAISQGQTAPGDLLRAHIEGYQANELQNSATHSPVESGEGERFAPENGPLTGSGNMMPESPPQQSHPNPLVYSGKKLSAEGIYDVFQTLRKTDSATTLNLRRTQLGRGGAITVAKELREKGALTALDLSHNDIDEAGAIALARAFRESPVGIINMEGNNIGAEGEAAMLDLFKQTGRGSLEKLYSSNYVYTKLSLNDDFGQPGSELPEPEETPLKKQVSFSDKELLEGSRYNNLS